MAFDQNQLVKDLQQLNVAQAVPDETHIAQPITTGRNVETFFRNPLAVESGSPGSGTHVFYQATGSDGGFVGSGYPNAPQWCSKVPVAIGHGGRAVGFNHAHNLGNFVGHNATDQASNDMAAGFVYSTNLASGFGCSPNRASHEIDHVSEEGGDDSSSGKKVKILCSFGGRILPRPCDGMLRYVGGKTRIISVRRDVGFNELVHRMTDAYGQAVVIKYQLPDEDLDALVSVSCADDLDNMMDEYEKLLEKSPDGSAKLRVFLFSASEPDSEVEFSDLRESGQKYVEAVNSSGDGVCGGIMRKESGMSASTQNSEYSVPETVDSSGSHDPNPSISLVSNTVQHQQQPTNYMHTYVDPKQEVTRFPNPQYTQQQFHDNVSGVSAQFMPGMHVTVTPSSSHVGMRPPMMQQPLQTLLDCYPEESPFGGRVVQLPMDQNYGPYQSQAQAPSAMVGGGFVSGPNQYIMDCLMCQKALPHAHSDASSQEERDSVLSPISDSNVRSWPLNRTAAHMDHQVGTARPETIGFSQNHEPQYETERIIFQKTDNHDHHMGLMGYAGDVQSPHGVFMGGNNFKPPLVPIQYQVSTDPSPIVVLPNQTSKAMVQESPKIKIINRPQQVVGREGLVDTNFSQPPLILVSDHNKVEEMLLPSHSEVPHVHNLEDPSKVVLEDVEIFPLEVNMPSSSSPPTMTCGPQDFSHSLFSNQDPWNRQQDPHLFPPKLTKLETEKESFYTPFGDTNMVNGGELLGEMLSEDRVLQPLGNSDKDCSSDFIGQVKGSAEELTKQELQATAASAFQTATPSNLEDEFVSGANGEDTKIKVPGTVNFGFPGLDGLGRLQIIKNSDLEELQELGSGTFGTVYHGKWRGTDVAIKRINDRCFSGKASEQERMTNDFWNEAIKLADLHHPNVVAFYGVVLDGPEGSVATVTEYMVNGSLRTALDRNERSLDKRKRLLIAMDVAFGMEYLHGKNIVHFDLKSDNLLVNLRDHHRPICKVGDLGLSKVKCKTLISGGVRGTLPWMAPELLNGSSSLVSDKVDVFSFGIVLWELLTGEEPYADLHYGAIIGGIVSNTLRPAIPDWCDSEWRSMMERCWASEPPARPNFTDIANELRSKAAKLAPKGG